MLTLSSSSLDWALKQAERFGDTDIFPMPFEFSAIRHDWDRLVAHLSSSDILKWTVRPNRECLSPKSAYSFRISTQLDPLDSLIYSALIYEIGEELEAFRLSPEEGIVFSRRFDPQPDGTMFSRSTSYSQFQERTRELASRSNEQYVVVADIADFFPSVYHHRVENALSLAAPKKLNHAKATMHLLGGWRAGQSFGLSVGPSASRLIAEVAIHDVDQALLGERLTFARYVDDFRIFCNGRKDAYIALATLADILWKNHGLTLAAQKTQILPVEVFEQRYHRSGREAELERLSNLFDDLLDLLGLDNWYEDIDYDDLDDEQRANVEALNLEGMLNEQLSCENMDIQVTRFVLLRLKQLQDPVGADMVLTAIDKLYPMFTDVVGYLDSLKHLMGDERRAIGKKIIELIDDSIVSHLEYHRMHLLNLFATDSEWVNSQELAALLSQFSDHFTKRKLILALGKSGQNYWFRRHKTDWEQFSPWERRAFLRGASSLEGDERKYWYASIKGRLDPLEEAIVGWSQQDPITG